MDEKQPQFNSLNRYLDNFWLAPIGLLLLTLFIFAEPLFSPELNVLSKAGNDLYLYFIYARQFGFDQLRQGNLALWNPHVFSGTPFLGNFQSALLYPINWIHLILPLDKAINFEIAIHVFLTGLWMYFWTLNRGLHRLACFFSAAIWMFGAPFFLKIYAGHLAPLGAMCWIPLVLLSVDWIFERRYRAGVLLGAPAVAMQVLAGHPQTVYNTLFAVAVYSILRLARNPQRWRIAAAIALVFVSAVALSAVQILTGLQTAGESARASGGVPLGFARMFSLPPENFLTLFVPNFFGDMANLPYWGRAYLWEMSLFMGLTGLILAIYAIVVAPRATRRYWIPLGVLWFMALGQYTPLFDLFYHWLPGFNKFRGHSKFIIPAGVFVAMLTACGLDTFIRAPRHQRAMAWATFGAGALCLLCGAFLSMEAGRSFWQSLLGRIVQTNETYLPHAAYADSGFIALSSGFAVRQLWLAGGVCLLLGALWAVRGRWRFAPCAMAALGVLEVMVFAHNVNPTFPLEITQPRALEQFLAGKPTGDRILNIGESNTGMAIGANDIWGYDPIVLARYMAFMAWSQGLSADEVNSSSVQFKSSHRLYSMLRDRYVGVATENGRQFGEIEGVMPRLQLLQKYTVVQGRDRILSAMGAATFDPRRTVILETEPQPRPAPSAATGSARVVEESTDWMVIEADTPQPAILLVTDSYSQSWKAWGLPGSVQQEYSVLPANYILRAIPLQAGKHRLRLEYSPTAFHIGKWISILSLALYLLAVVIYFQPRFKPSH